MQVPYCQRPPLAPATAAASSAGPSPTPARRSTGTNPPATAAANRAAHAAPTSATKGWRPARRSSQHTAATSGLKSAWWGWNTSRERPRGRRPAGADGGVEAAEAQQPAPRGHQRIEERVVGMEHLAGGPAPREEAVHRHREDGVVASEVARPREQVNDEEDRADDQRLLGRGRPLPAHNHRDFTLTR